MYGNVKGGARRITAKEKMDTFPLIVSELDGQYINLLVIQKFPLMVYGHSIAYFKNTNWDSMDNSSSIKC